jgi:ribosomal protein S18 acetylase RimI-like enzyme
MTVDIVPVRAEDTEVLVALARAFHAEEGRSLDADSKAALVAIAQGEPLARTWLVRMGNEAVGYLIITLGYSVEYGGRDGFIDDFYLVPDVRGQGIGRQVLEFAFAQAVKLGIHTLHLEVEMDNVRATHLYRAAGFEETGRRLMRRLIVG